MILNVINHPFEFDMKNLCTIFFPYEKVILNPDKIIEDENIVIDTIWKDNKVIVKARVYEKTAEDFSEDNNDAQTALSVLFYKVMSGILGFKPPWGVLYGVRPARRLHHLADKFGSLDAASDYFVEHFMTTRSKASLAKNVALNENKIIALSKPNSFSLYVSIPFCPTRCSYCSFVSHSIENTRKLVQPYVDLLLEEIKEAGKQAKNNNLRLESVYFGGGTPTTLSPKDLIRIFKAIESNFDLSTIREYTVEAGRPDTVTKDKLNALKYAGVERISINPQSFNDDVLVAIGRHHTSQQTLEAFEMARRCGFNNINMDFIAGLPLDNLTSFKSSVDKAIQLSAESVTIHTLAMKSGAYLVTRDSTFDLKDRLTVSDMVDYVSLSLSSAGYYPYYMYRQSKSIGNLENVGWCTAGHDCLYNVFMMDETHTVIAVGAGAVTKLKDFSTGHIERVYNYKYPYEYINNFDSIIMRKKSITEFYNEYT